MGWRVFGRRGVARGRRAGARYAIEALEERWLLTIVVNGTDGNDTITMVTTPSRVEITVNGTTTTHTHQGAEIDGGGGNDTITIRSTPQFTATFVDGGNDDDTITVGGGQVLGLLKGQVLIDGGAGSDTVIVDDRLSLSSRTYEITGSPSAAAGTAIFFNGDTLPIQMDNDVQELRLLANDEANEIRVSDLLEMGLARIKVDGGALADRLIYSRVGGSAVMSFEGGTHADEFKYGGFFDGNQSVTFDGQTMRVGGVAFAEASSVSFFNVVIDGADDTFRVLAIPTAMEMTLDGGLGRDTYEIGDNDIDRNISGTLRLIDTDRQTPDRIIFQDTAGTSNDFYRLFDASFEKANLFNDIQFVNGGDDLVLNANAGGNGIRAYAPAARSVLVNGGLGGDIITYGDGGIEGPPATLNGGDGADEVVFDDSDAVDGLAADKDYILAGGILDYIEDGALRSQFTYSAEEVRFDAGGYNSIFVVDDLMESSLVINAGEGNDDLRFIPFATAASITFNGQGGSDTLDVDDSPDSSTAPDTYTLTKTSFTKVGVVAVNFATLETLTARLNNARNTLNVNGVASGLAASISAGSQPDLIRVGAGDIDLNVSGNILIHGNQGGDTIIFDDTADTGDDTYNLSGGPGTSTAVLSKANMTAAVTYGTVEHMELNGSAANTRSNVASPNFFPLDMVLRGFAGADTFVVTPSARTSITIEASDPTVPPGDVLEFGDLSAAGFVSFTPNGAVNGTYAFTAAEPVTFLGVETFPAVPVVSAPDLIAADDTGASAADGVTRKRVVTFVGTAPANAVVEIFAGLSLLGSGTATAGGAYSVPATFAADGSFDVVAVVRDPISRIAGASPALTVTIDTAAPTAPAASDLVAGSDSGVDSTDNITGDVTPTFAGAAPAGTVVRLFADRELLGTGAASISGQYQITSSFLEDGQVSITARVEDPAGNQSPPGPELVVTIDRTQPEIEGAAFEFQSAHAVRITFNEDVGKTLSASNLRLENAVSGVVIPVSSLRRVGDSNTFAFSGFDPRVLPDGDYRAALSTSGVTDLAGNRLRASAVLQFSVLAGDGNRDGRVNILDYFAADRGRALRLAGFSNGDFDYSGGPANGDDYVILDRAFLRRAASASGPALDAGASGPLSAEGPHAAIGAFRSDPPESLFGPTAAPAAGDGEDGGVFA